MSCSNDDALSDLDKIETYKASLKTLFTPDNLIVSTSTSENYITVAFEDGGDVAMESERQNKTCGNAILSLFRSLLGGKILSYLSEGR